MDNMRFRYSITLHSLSFKSKLEIMVIYISVLQIWYMSGVQKIKPCAIPQWLVGIVEYGIESQKLCVHFLFMYV